METTRSVNSFRLNRTKIEYMKYKFINAAQEADEKVNR